MCVRLGRGTSFFVFGSVIVIVHRYRDGDGDGIHTSIVERQRQRLLNGGTARLNIYAHLTSIHTTYIHLTVLTFFLLLHLCFWLWWRQMSNVKCLFNIDL